MKQECNLREMKLDDIEDVIEGETQIFGESLGYDMLYTELTFNPYAFYFVLEINEKVAGYIGLWINGEQSEIINFYVLKKYQNKGYGSAMLSFALDLIVSSGVPSISLEVRESNQKAIKLYESFGFIHSYTRKNYYKNHEDAFVMILEV